jgi:hypothetical protein
VADACPFGVGPEVGAAVDADDGDTDDVSSAASSFCSAVSCSVASGLSEGDLGPAFDDVDDDKVEDGVDE